MSKILVSGGNGRFAGELKRLKAVINLSSGIKNS